MLGEERESDFMFDEDHSSRAKTVFGVEENTKDYLIAKIAFDDPPGMETENCLVKAFVDGDRSFGVTTMKNADYFVDSLVEAPRRILVDQEAIVACEAITKNEKWIFAAVRLHENHKELYSIFHE